MILSSKVLSMIHNSKLTIGDLTDEIQGLTTAN